MITVVFKSRPIRSGKFISEDPLLYLSGSRSYRQNVNNRTWRPATDIYEIEDKIIVLVEIAGMTDDDFTITMDRNLLFIQGTRNLQIEERQAIHQMEIPFGEFTVEIVFPMELDLDQVTANYNNGFLMVSLPKATPKNIELNRD
ncbi:MAG: Hsp20/alpha crystallin family protein [Bellilinea sp.]